MNPCHRVAILDLHADDPEVDASVETGILADADVTIHDCRTPREIIAAAQDADVILFKACRLDREVLKHCKHLKGIVRYGIGLDKVDLDAAGEFGIPVCNVPDASTAEVATHNLTLALACLRALPALHKQSTTGDWRLPEGLTLHAPKTLMFATLGFGRIARETLLRAKGFGFHLAAHDPFVPADVMEAEGVAAMSADALFEQADVLVLQCPLTETTRHIINRRTLGLMKPRAVLINTARGELVDTDALANALAEDRLLGVGLDVTEPEPLPAGHPLYTFERVIITPHAGWYTEEARLKVRRSVAEEALRLLRGEPAAHRVV